MIIDVTPDSALREMLGEDDFRLTPVNGGGNSNVFRVDIGARRYALKQYPDEVIDPRQRQLTERTALCFLAECGLDCVPTFFTAAGNYSLYSWLEGHAVTTAADHDIADAVQITASLQASSVHTSAKLIAPAFEACFALNDLVEQLKRRLDLLVASHDGDPMLRDFFEGDLTKTFTFAVSRASAMYATHRVPAGDLWQDDQRVIHGDFGLHNMLRSSTGRLLVLDFEYFGWDDPVKMIADFALHPGMPLSMAHRALFLDKMMCLLNNDRLRMRLYALLPLFAIRWACIACNMFLPERRRRYEADAWETKKEQQLLKASSLLTLCAREGLL